MRRGAVLGVELPESAGLGCLALDDAQAALGGLELLAGEDEVRLRAPELALGLDASLLVAGDARGLLEDGAALLGAGQEHGVDLALLDDGVGVGADAGVEEEVADVAEAGAPGVDEVLALAVAVEAALDLDDVGVDGQGAPAGAVEDGGGLGGVLEVVLGLALGWAALGRMVEDRIVEGEGD